MPGILTSIHTLFRRLRATRVAAVALAALWLGLLSPAAAAPDTKDVPEVLKQWIPWVLHGKEEALCPAHFNGADKYLCAWPTRLELSLTDGGGRFTQTWRVFKRSWLSLPGNAKHWPGGVRVGDRAAVVADRNGVPSIRLEPGAHRVSGEFAWTSLPKSLRVPAAAGLIDLTVNGRAEAFPNFDGNGNLWLRQKRTAGKVEARRLSLRVFRHIDDDLPMRVTTFIRLDVAGEQREIVLGPVLHKDAIPLSLASALPARLEAGHRLRVQLRPGAWRISIKSRLPGPVSRLSRPQSAPPWPEDEVWVFAAHTDLRLAEVTGVQTIDPQQTSLPGGWKKLPAYRLKRGDVMEIVTKRRGDPKPAPDQLSLKRTIWLDFDGEGYTVRDSIGGSMRAGWRLDMNRPAKLGRVAVNGKGRFITESDGKAGVELRQGKVALLADSRLDDAGTTLNAVGWDHDFQRLSATLHLPPGWRLFSAGGADQASSTWLGQWTTMWPMFHVLIIVLAVAKLWDWRWGAGTLATLVLTYHEADGLGWALLSILAAVALYRAAPEGRLRRAVGWYRNLSLLALVVLALPFIVSEVRLALYPQLEYPWQSPSTSGERGMFNMFQDARGEVLSSAPVSKRKGRSRRLAQKAESLLESDSSMQKTAPRVQYQYDPGARITTGPGVPSWTWTTARLSWNGPVERGQTLRLTLMPPWLNFILRIAGAALVGALTVLMLSSAIPIPFPRLPLRRTPTAAAIALCALGAVASAPDGARAELPDRAMLDDLRKRLLEAPDCFPHCAQIPHLSLTVEGGRMTARVEVEAAEGVAVPLPGNHRLWRLRQATLDDAPVEALRRDKSGTLWAHVPKGRHVITLEGALAREAAIPLRLPLRPHRVTVSATGWSVDGIDENGVPQVQIRLTRLASPSTPSAPTLEPTTLPPFVSVERTLVLGLSWRVRTRVVRDSATRGAVVVNLPVLDGEQVTAANVRVRNGRVLVNMTPGQREVSWVSTLERSEALTLTAPQTTDWAELWRLDASPVWHVASAGLAPVFHQDSNGTWRPVWRPWPGETLSLNISRPGGVEGRTLTIDGSKLTVRPGERATDLGLTFNLRSSQGGQHVVRLPKDIRLDSVKIDGKLQPVRARDGALTLPIAPGKHKVAIEWQEKRSVVPWFTTSRVDLGVPSVNGSVELSLPRDRWVLITRGPDLGPAVLFWGILGVVVAIGLALHRETLTPLRWYHWILLGVGLTQTDVFVAVTVVGCLFALGGRRLMSDTTNKITFNLTQIGLAILTLVALGGLFFAVQEGLLGRPEMQVEGNRSSAYSLRWYQDQMGGPLPQAGVLTVTIWIYKFLMLAWSLWLAVALLKWARWGWGCYSSGGLWRQFPFMPPRPTRAPPAPSGSETPPPAPSSGEAPT